MARLALVGVVVALLSSAASLESSCAGSLGNSPEVRIGGTAGGQPVEVAVRECDEPEARADGARLWLEAAGLSSD